MTLREFFCPWSVIRELREEVAQLCEEVERLHRWRDQPRDKRGRFVTYLKPTP